MNAFALLELPESFDLDLAQLESRYYEQQKLFHPDRLVGKSAPERQAALQRSMQANEAYDTLKNPLKRARHLLALNGIEVGGERDTVKPDHALLTEIMEWRESIAEASSAEALAFWREKAGHAKAETLAGLSRAFTAQTLPKAAQLAIRLGYLGKIEDEIRVARKRFNP